MAMRSFLRRFRWVFVAAAAVAVCAAAYIGFLFLSSPYSAVARRLDPDLRRARAEGIAVAISEFRWPPSAPTAEDAAPLYDRAVADLMRDTSWRGNANTSAIGDFALGLGTDTEAKVVRAVIARFEEPIALATHAATCARCEYPIRVDPSGHLLLPNMPGTVELLRLILAKANLEERDGRPGPASIYLQSAYLMAIQIESFPATIPWLLGLNGELAADRCALGMARRKPNDRELLSDLLTVSANRGPLPNLRKSALGELKNQRANLAAMADWSDLATVARSDRATDAPDDSARTWPGWGIFKRATDDKLVRAYVRMAELLPTNPADWRATETALSTLSTGLNEDLGLDNVAALAWATTYARHAGKVALTIAWRRMLTLTLRLSLMTQLPTALPVERDSIDPFTERPFGYRRDATGFELTCGAPAVLLNVDPPQEQWVRAYVNGTRWRIDRVRAATRKAIR